VEEKMEVGAKAGRCSSTTMVEDLK